MPFLPYSMPQLTNPEAMHRIPNTDAGRGSSFASAEPAADSLGIEEASGSENFSVREVLSGLVDELDQGRGLVKIEGWQGPSVVVAGDRLGFKAVARECFDHALRHRRAHSVAVLVATDAVSWGQYRVRVEVSFVGSWLAPGAGEWWFAPPRFWRKMFGRITLLPESRLWVCRGLVQKLGGSVGVFGEGRHATLTIEVPFGAAGIGPAPAPAHIRRPGRRILLVEDEHYNRLVIGGLLRKLNCEVDWAADGAGALALASHHAYDAMLIDWCLPDTDGGSLARRLAETALQPGVPMFAITGHVAPGRLDECRAAGMAAVVFKPISEEKLFQVLGEWLVLERREPPRPTIVAKPPPPHLARSYSA